MNLEHIRKLLISGENVSLKYKECKIALTKDIYETVCAFLNRFGGEILLGVNNTGRITGVEADKIEQLKKEFVTAMNSPSKLSPTTYLTIEEFESYERLMEFIAKHLPDPFYQDEKANRISLSYKIFREVVSNILIHREYSNPYPINPGRFCSS